MDQITEMGHQALDDATEAATGARDTAKKSIRSPRWQSWAVLRSPLAPVELQRSSKTSHVDTLMERLSDLQQQLPKRWRA
jgi:hypothetical protein